MISQMPLLKYNLTRTVELCREQFGNVYPKLWTWASSSSPSSSSLYKLDLSELTSQAPCCHVLNMYKFIWSSSQPKVPHCHINSGLTRKEALLETDMCKQVVRPKFKCDHFWFETQASLHYGTLSLNRYYNAFFYGAVPVLLIRWESLSLCFEIQSKGKFCLTFLPRSSVPSWNYIMSLQSPSPTFLFNVISHSVAWSIWWGEGARNSLKLNTRYLIC